MRSAVVLLSWLALTGCGTDSEHPGGVRADVAATVEGTARDPVVARVDGVPIPVSAVARRAALAGVPADTAVAGLIDQELLVLEARRRGYDADQDVVEAVRRASVRVLLERTFERDFTPDMVTDSQLRELYDQQRYRFVHPERRTVVHALAASQSGATSEERAQSRAWAERLASDMPSTPLSPEAFEALANRQPAEGVRVVVERLTTVRHGHTVEPFARETFALERPGSTSAPVETEFGYHVIYLVSIEPAENHAFSEVRARLLRDAWPDLRRQAFERFVGEIQRRHQVSVDDAPLGKASGS